MSLSQQFQRPTSQNNVEGQGYPDNPAFDHQEVGAGLRPPTPHQSFTSPIALVAPSAIPAPRVTLDPSRSPTYPDPSTIPRFKRSIKVALDSWGGLKRLVETLNKSGMFGPLQAVAEELAGLAEMYERVGQGKREYEALQEELENVFNDLREHLSGAASQAMTRSIKNLCHEIESKLKTITSKIGKRHKGADDRRSQLEFDDSNDVLICYQKIRGYFHRLTLNANISMWKIADEHATDAVPDRLATVMAAMYNSAEAITLKRGGCTEGTRVDVLAQMHNWVYNSPAGAVYWLNGMAGTGKTTIAYSLCNGLDTAYRLGASFFCSRLLPECRDVNRIIPSIAYQLARFSRPFRCALLQALAEERDIHRLMLNIQFESLVLKPLTRVQGTLPTDLVIVIDALDECDNKDSTRQILDLVLAKTWTLPVRFLVSSRPEPQIRDEMMLQGGLRANQRLVLHELDSGAVQADIATYLRSALAPMNPLENELSELANRAGVLFIYAATAVRFIGYDNFHKNPRTRLRSILNGTGSGTGNENKEIDSLYAMILNSAANDPDLLQSDKQDILLVLHTVVCAREPLTISALSGLLQLYGIERVNSALRPLWSVLHVMELSGKVTTLHASFSDYMFDPARSTEYHCNLALHNQFLAHYCLECIDRTQPKFNICSLGSSYIPDADVPGLAENIQSKIPTELFYASRYWASHLSGAAMSSILACLLEVFLSRNALLWMELLNLKKCIHLSAAILWQAEGWCMRQNCPTKLLELVHDAWRYALAFSSSAVSQSTPHIYTSMLPFWPTNNPFYMCYAKYMQRTVEVTGIPIENRQLFVLASWEFESCTQVAIFSPDTSQIALGFGKSLLLLDAFTGQVLLDVFQGHSGSVTSIDFSHNGAQIVSGSEDHTIRIWESQTGEPAITELQGHTESVTCVKFSPDGSRIISGSRDATLRLWNAQTGIIMLDPFRGHRKWVTAACFSPDGTRIVSGSSDHTVCVWNATTGQCIHVLTGHFSRVSSVGFSTDGSNIVTGSYDKTVRVWSAQSGKRVGRLFKGHSDRVTTISISPDTRHVVSGSADKSIRVWDLETGTTVLGPLMMHTGAINSVAFSTRASHLISTSSDKCLKVWDLQNKQIMPGQSPNAEALQQEVLKFPAPNTQLLCPHPLYHNNLHTASCSTSSKNSSSARDHLTGPDQIQRHSERITSVAFSSSGSAVISGSWDKTLRVWDFQKEVTILGPLQGHTFGIMSVAFSPNGSCIASSSLDNTIRFWDPQSGRAVLGPLERRCGGVRSIAFSCDGSHIASGGNDGAVCLWELQSERMILGPLRGHSSEVTSVAFSPDRSCVISGGNDATIRAWSTQSGNPLLEPLRGHTGMVFSVVFSPDGSRIASGSEDKTIRVWDSQTGETVVAPLQGHMGWVNSVAFSPDGSRIASGSSDMSVRVWNLQTGAQHWAHFVGMMGVLAQLPFPLTTLMCALEGLTGL